MYNPALTPSTQESTVTNVRFASALSTESNTARAVDEVCRQVLEQLAVEPSAAPADLAVLFVSKHHGPPFGRIAEEVQRQIGSRMLVGCVGQAVLGGAREIEGEPAISLWLASLPGSTLTPMRLEYQRNGAGGSFVGWPASLADTWADGSGLLLLAEPFSFPADVLLERLNNDHPQTAVFGGMASGGLAPSENRLFFGGEELDTGAVAVLIEGGVKIHTVVSQGCRPIGQSWVITKAEHNEIYSLGGKPPLARLQALLETLPTHEKQLLQRGLHIGRVINEYQSEFHRGDFLVKNVIAADTSDGSIAIGDYVRAGQTVQFHLRDDKTADEDLRELLGRAAVALERSPAGALLFTCNGRGTQLFDHPHHDAAMLQETFGDIPLAGFFAQGEIGPIGGQNFLHGFTASVVLFEPLG